MDDERLVEEDHEKLKDAAELQYLNNEAFDFDDLSARSMEICGKIVSPKKMENLARHGRWLRSAKSMKAKFDILLNKTQKERLRGESEIAEESAKFAVILKRVAQVMGALSDQSMRTVMGLINQAAKGDDAAKAQLAMIAPTSYEESAKLAKTSAELFALGHGMESAALTVVSKEAIDPMQRGNLKILSSAAEGLSLEDLMRLATALKRSEDTD